VARPRSPHTAALARFAAEGIAPDLALARSLARGDDPAARFSDALSARRWTSLTDCARHWPLVTVDHAVTFLAACRYRSLAYQVTRGDPAAHLAAARELVESLGVTHARLNADLADAVSPRDLSLPKGGWGYASQQGVSDATFEASALLVGDAHAALVVWTAED
jgi:hypothetical protein